MSTSDTGMQTQAKRTAHVVLRQGDCIERMKEFPDGSIGAIVSDPPYGLEFMAKDFDSFRVLSRDFDTLPDAWVQDYQDEEGGGQ